MHLFYQLTPTCLGIVAIFRELTTKFQQNYSNTTNPVIFIVAKKLCTHINNIVYVWQNGMQLGSRIYFCVTGIVCNGDLHIFQSYQHSFIIFLYIKYYYLLFYAYSYIIIYNVQNIIYIIIITNNFTKDKTNFFYYKQYIIVCFKDIFV